MTDDTHSNVTALPTSSSPQTVNFADYCEKIKVVRAKSPTSNVTSIQLSANPELIQKLAALKLNNKLFDYSYLVCDVPPLVNNIGYHERNSGAYSLQRVLSNPTKIYQGLERPYINEGDDENVYIYVSNPSVRYKYIPDMACAAKRVAAPKNAVFVIYVKLDDNNTEGTIIGWEWVKADAELPNLPSDYDKRYNREVWSNE